jgi:hypothetical protein
MSLHTVMEEFAPIDVVAVHISNIPEHEVLIAYAREGTDDTAYFDS